MCASTLQGRAYAPLHAMPGLRLRQARGGALQRAGFAGKRKARGGRSAAWAKRPQPCARTTRQPNGTTDRHHEAPVSVQGSLEGLARLNSDTCPECGLPMIERRRDAIHCSDKCYWAAWERKHPRRHPVPVDPVKARRLRRSALRILGQLQTGPATNLELQTVGGLRYGARLHELRQAGHRIRTDEDKARGIVTYTLSETP